MHIGSRRGRPKRDEADEENDEGHSDSKAEEKEEEPKKEEVTEENGKLEETEKKENSVDSTDAPAAESKPETMEVEEETPTPAPAQSDKSTDNGPTDQPSSPAKEVLYLLYSYEVESYIWYENFC